MKAVRVRRGEWGIQWPDGVVANGYPSREAAERCIARGAEREREMQRRAELVDLLLPSSASGDEIVEAINAGGSGPLEQLAAQYGLLKQGAA